MNRFHCLTAAFSTLAASTLPIPAAIFMDVRDSIVAPGSGAIPDDLTPVSFSLDVSDSPITRLTEVRISFSLHGDPTGEGWAGDLFASLNLNLGSRTSILLNRPGLDAANPLGASFAGWNVTLADNAAAGDIHQALPAPGETRVSGTWQPDGRINPLDTSRPARLDVFQDIPANGTWFFTLADLSPGGTMALDNWSLTLIGETGAAVPEPISAHALATLGLAFATWRVLRHTASRSRPQRLP